MFRDRYSLFVSAWLKISDISMRYFRCVPSSVQHAANKVPLGGTKQKYRITISDIFNQADTNSEQRSLIMFDWAIPNLVQFAESNATFIGKFVCIFNKCIFKHCFSLFSEISLWIRTRHWNVCKRLQKLTVFSSKKAAFECQQVNVNSDTWKQKVVSRPTIAKNLLSIA